MKEIEKTMYFGANPTIFEKAKILRGNMTKAEELLWDKMKGKKIGGFRFRRQHPIDIFIADFYCHEARLVIELDGEIHSERKDYDDGRTADLEKFHIKVIRFFNKEVEKDIDKVIRIIESELESRIKSPPWGI